MLHKSFSQITLEDILALQTDNVEEGKNIDYKLELDFKNKKEFANDITSFANTSGGDLIVGISEEKGVITGFPGIEVQDKDSLRLRIENMLRDFIEPQIIGLEMKFYELQDMDKYILHIRIPQSYVGPHIVNKEKFFGRNNGGKYPLDFVEIKQKFNLSNQVHEKIKQYHLERVMKIKADEGYWELQNGSSILINIIPLQSFSESVYVSALTPDRFKLDTLFGESMYEPKIQFEGIAGNYYRSYHHINRQGIIEIADMELLNFSQPKVYTKPIIERIQKTIPSALYNLKELGLDGPYVILTSLLDVKDKLFTHNEYDFSTSKTRQNDMFFPAILITNYAELNAYDRTVKELFMNISGHFYTQYSL